MSYDLSYKEHGFFLNFTGNITIDELNQGNGDIHGHPEFDNHTYQIVDLSNADLSSVTEEDGEFPAVADGIASQTKWDVKVAFIAQDSYTIKIVNSYCNFARAYVPKWKFGIFSTFEDALKWIKPN